jgi:hypothetical protein
MQLEGRKRSRVVRHRAVRLIPTTKPAGAAGIPIERHRRKRAAVTHSEPLAGVSAFPVPDTPPPKRSCRGSAMDRQRSELQLEIAGLLF